MGPLMFILWLNDVLKDIGEDEYMTKEQQDMIRERLSETIGALVAQRLSSHGKLSALGWAGG